jgi:alkylation response protein AidB-like acyl-CoA dehydrogenase
VNFDLSQDEEMFKAVAERFVSDRYDPDRRRSYLAEPWGFSADNWKLLGELGLISAMFGTDEGGLGVGETGLAAIFEAFGRGLVVEPLAQSLLLAGGLFARTASAPLKAQWMPDLVSGARRLALAHREQGARKNDAWAETTAQANGQGQCLSGEKSVVPAGYGVDAYIVSARVSGGAGDRDGTALFLIDAGAKGVTINPWRLIDGSTAITLTLDQVQVDGDACLGDACLGGGLGDIEAAQSQASLAASAEALGIMERLFADTLDYLKTRTQFGVALGNFQALQHRMVAQYSVLEQSRGLLNLAVIENTPRAIDGARAFIAEASILLGHEMIQMHGGMGVTDELMIGQGHKRLIMLSRWPGDASAALDRYAAGYTITR